MLPVKPYLKNVVRVKNPAKTRCGFLRLDKNENPISLPESLVEKIRSEITAEFLMMYPEIDPLYDKIAEWLNCEVKNLFITAGSDGAIKSVFEAFVEPNDTVMILDPTYAMYYVYINLFQAKLAAIQYDESLTLDVNKVLEQIKQVRPKLVCLANPNSPTGTILTLAELERIILLCQEMNTVILIDEAYFLYWEETVLPYIHKCTNLVITRSFSKAIGLAAARLGVAIGHEEIIQSLHSWRPMYEVNGLAVKAAMLLLDSLDMAKENVKKALMGKAYLEAQLNKHGIQFFKSYANFVHIKVGSPEKSKEIVKKLYEDKILVAGGFKAPLQNCLRVSIGDQEQMQIFLEAFLRAL